MASSGDSVVAVVGVSVGISVSEKFVSSAYRWNGRFGFCYGSARSRCHNFMTTVMAFCDKCFFSCGRPQRNTGEGGRGLTAR